MFRSSVPAGKVAEVESRARSQRSLTLVSHHLAALFAFALLVFGGLAVCPQNADADEGVTLRAASTQNTLSVQDYFG